MTDPRQLVAWQRERHAQRGGPLWPSLTEIDWCEFADQLADALEAAVARANQLEKACERLVSEWEAEAHKAERLSFDIVAHVQGRVSGIRACARQLHAALSGVPAEPATEEKPDEWCPGHGSFSERRPKSECAICRGEYMPEQTVSAGAGQVPADTIERLTKAARDTRELYAPAEKYPGTKATVLLRDLETILAALAAQPATGSRLSDWMAAAPQYNPTRRDTLPSPAVDAQET